MANQINVTSGTGNIQVTTSRSVIAVTTVANANTANVANYAGNVTGNAQPNITSVGTLTGLTSSGNITAPYFIGNVVGNISGNIVVPGTNTSVLFNQVGSAGASDALQFDYSANVLKVTGNANVTGKLTLGGNIEGNLLPQANGTQDIGSNTQRWNDLYLNGNTIYLGSQTLESNATHTTISGVITGNGAGLTNVTAATANSVAVGNVTGIGNIATINLDGNASNVLRGDGTFVPESMTGNANYANFAGTAFSVSGSNVSGTVANANFATNAGTANIANSATVANSANSVAGANVTGTVANATFATSAGSANTANSATVAASANSVAGANVSGEVANANYASFANVANSANSVAVANVSGIGNIATINLNGNGSQALLGNGVFGTPLLTGDAGNISNIPAGNINGTIANANFAAYAGEVTDASQPNITSVGNLTSLTVVGNVSANNYNGNSYAVTTDYTIETPGYYYPYAGNATSGTAGGNVVGFNSITANTTSGSNVITISSIVDRTSGTNVPLANAANALSNTVFVGFNTSTSTTQADDRIFPIGTTVVSVDAPNNQATLSNVASSTNTSWIFTNGVLLANTTQNSYFIAIRDYVAEATATNATGNVITVSNITSLNSLGANTKIVFSGTVFGGVTQGDTYFVKAVNTGNSTITISTTAGGAEVALSTASGQMYIGTYNLRLTNQQPLSAGFYYSGPWTSVPVSNNFTFTPNTFTSNPTLAFGGYQKSININDNVILPNPNNNDYNQLFTKVKGGLVVGEDGTSTSTGLLSDQQPVNGVTIFYPGTNANNTSTSRYQVLAYTDNAPDNASLTGALNNPPSFIFDRKTGNINTTPTDQYIRSGRVLGRIGWTAPQLVGSASYQSPQSTPPAGIYVQALGDWNSATTTSLPMCFAIQYSPLNALSDAGNTFQRIPRTFLQASNNQTFIGGASSIQFKPLATGGTNNNQRRQPHALGNTTYNAMTFAEIGGYTQGNAASNGVGSLTTITSTSTSWNGNVALRINRTHSNTANMEFQLPVGSANTMLLIDNASGNTIATFTNGNTTFVGDLRANFLYGNGSNISSIAGANVTGTVANANVANNVANNVTILQDFGNTNAQYITYVGANTSGDQKVKVDLSFSYSPNNNIVSVGANGGFNGKLFGANTFAPNSFVSVSGASGNITANVSGNTKMTINTNGINVTGNIDVSSSNIILDGGNGIGYFKELQVRTSGAANATVYANGYISTNNEIDYLRTYGEFFSNVTQTNPVANTVNYMTFNNTGEANGVSIASNSQITIARTGLYNLQFRAKMQHDTNQTANVEILLYKNGTAQANTNTRLVLQKDVATITSWNFVVNANTANDYYQIGWASADTNVEILNVDAANTIANVNIPSTVVSVVPVGA